MTCIHSVWVSDNSIKLNSKTYCQGHRKRQSTSEQLRWTLRFAKLSQSCYIENQPPPDTDQIDVNFFALMYFTIY